MTARDHGDTGPRDRRQGLATWFHADPLGGDPLVGDQGVERVVDPSVE
jgi:hypothetical protein